MRSRLIAASLAVCAAGCNGVPAPALAPAVPAAAARPHAAQKLYVASRGNGSVLVFSTTASGNAAPVQAIRGSATTLTDPEALAVDSSGHIFTENGNFGQPIDVFSATAKGNVKPLFTIGGSKSKLDAAAGFAFDSSGVLYAAQDGNGLLTEYAAGAKGNVAPIRTLQGSSTYMSYSPYDAALDSARNLYVALVSCCVAKFKPGANGNVKPALLAGGATALQHPNAVALMTNGSLVVADEAGYVLVFKPGATGDAPYYHRISGSFTSPSGLALDAANNIYVSDALKNEIFVFASTANGSATPIRTIAGAKTLLSGPANLAIR
ncbi:MAG: hypothetical protein JO199_13640 [Candidatus Eremiobacteraeota bacterium]|nr:hypothetical protein [Candidatus Eremiobacteraeota bacterium]